MCVQSDIDVGALPHKQDDDEINYIEQGSSSSTRQDEDGNGFRNGVCQSKLLGS